MKTIDPAPQDRQTGSASLVRVGVCIDTPNITRSVVNKCGAAARPDWRALLVKAGSLGSVAFASAVVNNGLPLHATARFERAGYSVARATGVDCDEWVVSAFVAMAVRCDVLLLVGGDHIYANAVTLARKAGKRVVVVGVPGSCARALTAAAHEVWGMPVYYKPAVHSKAISLNAEIGMCAAG